MHKRSVLGRLAGAYVAFIALWLVLRGLFFDRFWPLALLNTAAEYLFILLPPLLIAAAWQRHRTALLGLGLAAVPFALLFGELFWPPFAGRVDGRAGQPITVMTYNVLYLNRDYGAVAGSIRDASADLVGLQELTPAGAQAIATELQGEYPYSTLQPLGPGRSAGLLSRFPIETAEWFPLPPLDVALHATVRSQGGRIHVFVVHLSANNVPAWPPGEFARLIAGRYRRRAGEVSRLREEIVGLPEPALLLCDCNLTDTSEAYARLGGFMRDSFRAAGRGLGHTYPAGAPFPLQRIDYVWYTDGFMAVEAFTGQAGGSDHRPAIARLRLVAE